MYLVNTDNIVIILFIAYVYNFTQMIRYAHTILSTHGMISTIVIPSINGIFMLVS